MTFERARTVADAVLYEGYALYPYRASAGKNRVRWQFGVLAPRAWSEDGGCEASAMRSECLVETEDATVLTGVLRFLQIQRRSIEEASDDAAATGFRAVPTLEIDGQLWVTWDEGVEREVAFEVALDAGALGGTHEIPFEFPARHEAEPLADAAGRVRGRVVRAQSPIAGVVRIATERVVGPYALAEVGVRVENVTPWSAGALPRDAVLGSSFLGTHTLLALSAGTFVSVVDPPEWASAAAAACTQAGAWPILLADPGERDTLMCSPIILPDHPEIAPESPADLFDATEIDEILTLRTMTLTDDEKREARATDARVAAIIDRVDAMPPEILGRLHGALRGLRDPTTPPARAASAAPPPWWDPGADASVSPETDTVNVGGVAIARGSRVRLRPSPRGADAQDMFLAGRVALVEAVFCDVEDRSYLAVTLDGDPASELQQWHGRYLYFAPDEVEPLGGER